MFYYFPIDGTTVAEHSNFQDGNVDTILTVPGDERSEKLLRDGIADQAVNRMVNPAGHKYIGSNLLYHIQC